MKITWGKPKILYAIAGASPVWIEMPTQEEGSVQLSTQPGPVMELKGEGGTLVTRRTSRPTYTLTMDVFIAMGDTRPIETNEGIIEDDYAVRLIPEDTSQTGYTFLRTSVEAEEQWTSEKGTMVRYTFTPLRTDSQPIENLTVVSASPLTLQSQVILTVQSVVPITRSVAYGTTRSELNLPTTVTVTLSDSTTRTMAVAFGGFTPIYSGTTPGTYTVNGVLTLPQGVTNPNNITVPTTVEVRAEATTEAEIITAIEDAYREVYDEAPNQ